MCASRLEARNDGKAQQKIWGPPQLDPCRLSRASLVRNQPNNIHRLDSARAKLNDFTVSTFKAFEEKVDSLDHIYQFQ
ncbi:hypothetical protein PanWU01x14_364260 [Parasponia andersonii]|uniref:Uncharacterized protein n=1 Tax=Parasponia andersonii TaxID=3476 RepID=A0A2P5A6E3_PARAD|nr:hypothetical protein PanWU01x14_364260 [Parasponia andersonii]